MTSFKVDVDDIKLVSVARSMILEGSFKEVVKIELARRKESKLGLNVATDEDRIMLYEELKRGASGLYANVKEPEDFDED